MFTAGALCPDAVDGDYAVTNQSTVPVTYLVNAWEIVDPFDIYFSYTGNHNGLCESNENCFYAPNIGAYQGHGEVIGTCNFADGVITGVKMYGFADNGNSSSSRHDGTIETLDMKIKPKVLFIAASGLFLAYQMHKFGEVDRIRTMSTCARRSDLKHSKPWSDPTPEFVHPDPDFKSGTYYLQEPSVNVRWKSPDGNRYLTEVVVYQFRCHGAPISKTETQAEEFVLEPKDQQALSVQLTFLGPKGRGPAICSKAFALPQPCASNRILPEPLAR